MNSDDHYQSPDDESAETNQVEQLGDPATFGAGNGWLWIKNGFDLFRQDIGLWIGMVVAYMVVMALLSFAPMPGVLVGLAAPLFTAGFMVAGHHASSNGSMDFTDMFAGFKKQTMTLLVLGLIYIGFVFLIGTIVGSLIIAFGAEDIFLADPETMPDLTPEASWIMLFALLMFMPLAMGMWFSPALIMLHNIRAWKAFKLSLLGCLKNIWPLIIYGIIVVTFSILAAIPFGLGFFILVPVVMCSLYVSYRDIFVKTVDPQQQNSLLV